MSAPEARTLTNAAFADTTARVEAELDPLYRGLRITSAWGEYVNWWMDEYDLLRGRNEAELAGRIRLFNALHTKRHWGSKLGFYEWMGGFLDCLPVLEEAYRGHWAWFPGLMTPGETETQSLGYDTYLSSPFMWDCWVWKTPADARWGPRTPQAWLNLMRPLKTQAIIRTPADPYKLIHAAHDPDASRPWITHALSEGTVPSGMQTDHEDADGYVTVTTEGVETDLTYLSPELDLGPGFDDWRWFPDWVVLWRRYGSNRVRTYMRSRPVQTEDAWSSWTQLHLGEPFHHYIETNVRYFQFKVEAWVHSPDDLAIATLGLKALTPLEISAVYLELDQGTPILGGGGLRVESP